MKGFLARNQQALAIASSAAVLVIVAGTLTGIILAGRHGSPTAKPTPSPTFNTSAPTPGPSETASATATGSPSPGASASAAASATSSGTPGPLSTPIGFGNVGAGCLGLANCTPPPHTTPTAAAAPAVTASFHDLTLKGGAVAAVSAPDGATVWFSEGSNGYIGSVSATSSLKEVQLTGLADPMAMSFDNTSDHNLWVIDGNSAGPAIVELDGKTVVAGGTPNVIATFKLGQGTVQSSPSSRRGLEGIAVDNNNDIWFSEFTSRAVGHIPATQTGNSTFVPEKCNLVLTQTNALGDNPGPLIKGLDNKLYIGTNNGVGVWQQPSSCTSSGTYNEFQPQGCTGQQLGQVIQSLAVGPDSKVWFGTPAGVGEYNGSVAAFVACNGSGMTGDHLAVVTAPDPSQPGKTALWAAFSGQGTVGLPGVDRVYGSTGTALSDSAESASADLRAIVKDASGNLWLADANGKIVEATPAKKS